MVLGCDKRRQKLLKWRGLLQLGHTCVPKQRSVRSPELQLCEHRILLLLPARVHKQVWSSLCEFLTVPRGDDSESVDGEALNDEDIDALDEDEVDLLLEPEREGLARTSVGVLNANTLISNQVFSIFVVSFLYRISKDLFWTQKTE